MAYACTPKIWEAGFKGSLPYIVSLSQNKQKSLKIVDVVVVPRLVSKLSLFRGHSLLFLKNECILLSVHSCDLSTQKTKTGV